MIRIIPVVCISLLLFSCEKKLLEESKTGTPVIYFQALFNGNPVNYKAGISSVYADKYRVLDKKDSSLTFVFFLGNILNQSKRYVEIAINNFRVPYLNENDINSTIIPGNFFYFPKSGNPKHNSEVIINWYNDNNEYFTSSAIDQSTGHFTILSTQDTLFILNGEQVKLKKTNISFRCRLVNISKRDTVYVTNGNASVVF